MRTKQVHNRKGINKYSNSDMQRNEIEHTIKKSHTPGLF